MISDATHDIEGRGPCASGLLQLTTTTTDMGDSSRRFKKKGDLSERERYNHGGRFLPEFGAQFSF